MLFPIVLALSLGVSNARVLLVAAYALALAQEPAELRWGYSPAPSAGARFLPVGFRGFLFPPVAHDRADLAIADSVAGVCTPEW